MGLNSSSYGKFKQGRDFKLLFLISKDFKRGKFDLDKDPTSLSLL